MIFLQIHKKVTLATIVVLIATALAGGILYALYSQQPATETTEQQPSSSQAAVDTTEDFTEPDKVATHNKPETKESDSKQKTADKTKTDENKTESPTSSAPIRLPSKPSPSQPTPPPTPPSTGGCTLPAIGQGGYPLPNLAGRANICNTGPRYDCTTTRDTLTTSSHGQVIERMCINGSLEIRHNNVTVRDVLVMGTRTYALDIGQYTDVCPANLRVEYTEINMTNAADMDWGLYQRCAGGHTFDHIKILYAGRGMMAYGNLTLKDSYIYSNRTQPDAHRTAFSTHGGSNFNITGNTLICVNTGCSSSLNIYSDYAPATNVLIQNNLVAGGSICMRGGETHAYAAQTSNIRVLNNRFSTIYAPQCGTFQAFAQFDESAPGNLRSGNIFHESGSPIPGE